MQKLKIEKKCTVCGSKSEIRIAGPLYIDAIKEENFCQRVLEELKRREMGEKKEAVKIIEACIAELDIPFYFEHHAICKVLKVPPSSISLLIEALREKGFSASRTHFSGTAFKTDAGMEEIKEILKDL
jgi:tRNA (guanine26-N2/guanine27-N2)-dimethyltransferase